MNEKIFAQELTRIRREIHRHPELGNEEFKTSKLVEGILKKYKIPFKRISKTGIVGLLNFSSSRDRRGSGRCIALRADMDALPLVERTRKSYGSTRNGYMHACGHDAHVSMLLGAAALLSKKRFDHGAVKFFFQPNEEGAGGAQSLIRNGAMGNPAVNATVGLHVNPRLPTGMIGLKTGPLMAAVDKFTLEVTGVGGHAAYPHEGRDAVSLASEIVQSLQTIVSRRIDPLDPVVLTIGTFNAGSRFNILAEKAVLTGTVRTLSESVHKKMPRLIRQIVQGVCHAHGGRFSLNYETVGSVLSNSKTMIDLSEKAAHRLFGRQKIRGLEKASMGGEDFSEYLKKSPGCFIYIGTGNSYLKTEWPWHHPQFDIDERALPVGAKLLAGIAEEFLTGGNGSS